VSRMVATASGWLRADRARRRVGLGIEVHEEIGSTNDRARALLDVPGGAGRAVVAELQTAGRGRRGRTWVSPAGRNLTMSVAVRPRLAASEAWQLALGAALAARDTCAMHAPVALKWPNDVVATDGAKLGGLLLETTLDGALVTAAVIGIGINVNWRRNEMPPELAESATSLADLAGAPIDRAELLGTLLDRLDDEVSAIEDGTSPIARYREACATLGTDVAVHTADDVVAGRAADVDERGALVIDTGDRLVAIMTGEVQRVSSGGPR
jgi:BirA family transcriptional regulator, biotin operon repressor / biotin---[acetyl-CoA-carboxylase] ligase